jgi:hypothetical protein
MKILATAAALVTAIAVQACAGGRAREHDIISFSNFSKAWESSRGAGATVAIVDWQFDLGWRARGKYTDAVSVVPGEEIGAMKPWHGEWMAEIVHAVAPDARIIPINARTLKDRDYQKYLVQGIRYAADHGAIAVASSMGPTIESDEFRAAIDYAWVRGTMFIDVHPERVKGGDGKLRACGAGECDPRIVHAGVVSVPDHPATPDAARDIYVWPYDLEPHFEDGWGYSNGPPTVAGAIALIKAANPALTPAAIKALLVETASVRNGFRVLDAAAAVSAARGAGLSSSR